VTGIRVGPFGTLPDGRRIDRCTLTGSSGLQAEVLTYGGIVRAIRVPDRGGAIADVALGFASLGDYVDRNPYFGCITGRYANRIAGGRFTLDGVEYRLATNQPPNHLHGGDVGFDKRVWAPEPLEDGDRPGVRLAYTSPDGEEGFPGTLDVEVDYRVEPDGALRIDHRAATDAPTVVNLTNHTLFNLAGEGAGTVYDHVLSIHADRYVPVDATSIPLGELASVDGTPMDFRVPTQIGTRLDAAFDQLVPGRGYDHTFVLGDAPSSEPRPAARVVDPATGRTLEVLTTEPGVQLYVGNHLDGTLTGKRGRPYPRGGGLALETQHFPDSPNRPGFPSTVLRPGQTYSTTTIFRFGVDA
jgi:aldose 1-epimerase